MQSVQMRLTQKYGGINNILLHLWFYPVHILTVNKTHYITWILWSDTKICPVERLNIFYSVVSTSRLYLVNNKNNNMLLYCFAFIYIWDFSSNLIDDARYWLFIFNLFFLQPYILRKDNKTKIRFEQWSFRN